MNPKNFLIIGGIVLVVVGVAGLAGIIGPTPEASIFGSFWWFDDAENWAHLILGIAALIIAFAAAPLQGPITLIVGLLGLAVGVWGFMAPDLLGANLENPADNILHLVVGLWAILSWRGGKSPSPSGPAMPISSGPAMPPM